MVFFEIDRVSKRAPHPHFFPNRADGKVRGPTQLWKKFEIIFQSEAFSGLPAAAEVDQEQTGYGIRAKAVGGIGEVLDEQSASMFERDMLPLVREAFGHVPQTLVLGCRQF